MTLKSTKKRDSLQGSSSVEMFIVIATIFLILCLVFIFVIIQ
ncbi:MAG TPA: hypothetical protein PLJ94_07715 [Methylotenera sp.]|nr:hypothetical protein [Methylotenera sp.]HPH08549.1 hypothetical protein [Methylotenera sp.]HPM48683.1 hypothetical protein [Methylotenera sp.]